MEKDLNISIKLQKRRIRHLSVAGISRLIAAITNNMGFTYSQLGLYTRAIRYYQRSFEMVPSEFPLSHIHIEIEQYDLNHARQHIVEARSITNVLSNFVEELRDVLRFWKGIQKLPSSTSRTPSIFPWMPNLASQIGELALLGQAYLVQGNPAAALKASPGREDASYFGLSIDR